MLRGNNHNCNQSKIPALLHGQQTLPGAFELPLKYSADVKLDFAFCPLVIVTSFAVSSNKSPNLSKIILLSHSPSSSLPPTH